MTHDDVISQLTFGNWSTLLGFTATPDPSSVEQIWAEALHRAFPKAHGGTSGRRFVGTRLDRLRRVRNRVSHHENLLEVDASNRLKDLLAVLSTIDSEAPSWAMANSRVRAVVAQDPRNLRTGREGA
ncbi:hypothetical protein [Gordonia phthalatica]|uniref:hypothetical protein n=1 Tax=Gordonia phthalatica TaxID=1136941 RepID=UPI0007845734|nr:hypothetical protein [Gordonia phthalatica]